MTTASDPVTKSTLICDVFRFQFMLRIQKAMSNNLCVNVLNGFNYQMSQFQDKRGWLTR